MDLYSIDMVFQVDGGFFLDYLVLIEIDHTLHMDSGLHWRGCPKRRQTGTPVLGGFLLMIRLVSTVVIYIMLSVTIHSTQQAYMLLNFLV